MEIQEDSSDENKTKNIEAPNLSLRKLKSNQKNSKKENNMKKDCNELLPGEIELKNEQLVFSHKKRLRGENISLLNFTEKESSDYINKEIINEEEKILSEKALEIFKELNIPGTKGLKEGEYDMNYHDKREVIVSNILKDEDGMTNQRKLACTTKNIDIYYAVLENFNTFSYYNNKFMVNSQNCLDKIVDNAFQFENRTKSIPLALKFANSVIEFGFFEEFHQTYVNYFIDIFLNEKKMKDINSIPRAKIYLYYILYLLFKDSWECIKIEKNEFKKFIEKILLDLSLNDHESTEIIIQIINSICDNILYPKIFNNQNIDFQIASIVNTYMFKLISEIIKNLGPEEKDKIIKVDNLNFIIKQSFNVIIKIITGINLINENNSSLQEMLVSKQNKQFFYEFILFFSQFNLEGKNFCWFLDVMGKFADILYYSDIFLKEEIIKIIFDKFIIKQNFICEVFQFMRSLLENNQLFIYFCACQKFYEALNNLDIDKNPYLTCVHYMFIIKELMDKGEANKCLDAIYDRLCVIQAKEKVEQIYYKYGNEEIIHKKYNEIMPVLDELSKKIEID